MPSPSESTAGKRKIKMESGKKSKCVDGAESELNKALLDCNDMIKRSLAEDEDEDSLYCRSLIPILRGLPTKRKRLAKIQISQLLFDLEYGED